MILGKGNSQLCGFLFDTGIKFLTSKCGEGVLHGEIKQTFVTEAIQPTGLPHEEPVKLHHLLQKIEALNLSNELTLAHNSGVFIACQKGISIAHTPAQMTALKPCAFNICHHDFFS